MTNEGHGRTNVSKGDIVGRRKPIIYDRGQANSKSEKKRKRRNELCGKILSRDREKEEGKSSRVCARKERGRWEGMGEEAVNEEVRYRIYEKCEWKNGIRGRPRGNRGPGAKVERKQVDNDSFNQISTTNKTSPRTPHHFTVHTIHDLPTVQ